MLVINLLTVFTRANTCKEFLPKTAPLRSRKAIA
jgi:hypothetical protein